MPELDLAPWTPPQPTAQPQVPVSGQGELELQPYGAQPSAEPTPPSSAPQAQTDSVQRMLIDTMNRGRAASQGVTSNVKAHSKNFLSDQIEETDTGQYVYKDRSGNLTPLNDNQHVILQDPADGRFKVYARSDETNANVAESLGHQLMLGSGPSGPFRAAASVPAAVAAGQRLGADLPRGITTESKIGQGLAKIFGRGQLAKATEGATEKLGEATQEAIARTGGSPDKFTAGASFERGVAEGFNPRSQSVLARAYDALDKTLDHTVRTPLFKTRQWFEGVVGRRGAYGDPNAERGAAGLISSALEDRQGLSFNAIKDLRTRIGEMLDKRDFHTYSEKELRGLYGTLSEDLQSAARNAGGARGASLFARANAAADYVKTMEGHLSKALGNRLRPDEGVADALFRFAQKGAGADIESLSVARKAVPAETWKDIAANAISRLGRDDAGEFNPAKFAKDFGNLSDAGKRALFSGAGRADLLPFLNDIYEVSDKLAGTGKLGGIGVGHATAGAVGAVEIGKEVISHAMEGNWKVPLAVLGGAVGAGVMGRILASAPSAASAARWTRAYAALVSHPTPATVSSVDMAARNLANTAADDVGVSADRLYGRIIEQLKNAVAGK